MSLIRKEIFMCGISIILKKDKSSVDEHELRDMTNLIAHRGPDGEGFYISGPVGFGHRRLAIIDLTKDGHQPMVYEENLIITYNGEVYNYLEIKEELLIKGHKFHSGSDTEVILAAYKEWGEDCVTHFNGMWAFAIHDKVENKVFFSRDRFGVKPLYYRVARDRVTFSSEIKQLLGKGENKANRDIISHYLTTGIVDFSDRTFFKDVVKLSPSHNLIFDLATGEFEIKRYFKLIGKSDLVTQEEFEALLTDSINLRLRSDVPVGTCLSGGLDSSLIATCASKLLKGKNQSLTFNGIHARSIEKASDESEYAKIVAHNSQINLHVTEPTSQDFWESLEEVVYTQEEPFVSPSVFLQYFVMKKARENKCIVLLDGQGADEVLLGYERYYPLHFITSFVKFGPVKLLQEIKRSIQNNTKITPLAILKYFAGSLLTTQRALFFIFKNNIFKLGNLDYNFDYYHNLRGNLFDEASFQETELFSTNLQSLLRYEDKNSMRHSIETRLPFLDYRFVKRCVNATNPVKIESGWTKFFLRKFCARLLPDEISWRKNKIGFVAPNKSWLQHDPQKIIFYIQHSEILNNFVKREKVIAKIGEIDSNMVWRLINVAVWEQQYRVKI